MKKITLYLILALSILMVQKTVAITWLNEVGVSSTTNSLTKTGSYGWNSGASSQETLNGNGYIEFQNNGQSARFVVGLNQGDTNQNFTEIDFAIYSNCCFTKVYENGVSKGVFAKAESTDVLKIEVIDSQVKYLINDTTIYTSLNSPAYPLNVDSSFLDTGGSITNISLVAEGPQNIDPYPEPLDYECEQVPLPLKIDCPNDEFFLDQWSADYMGFAKGWYYTHPRTRVGVSDTVIDSYINEFNENIRKHNIGTFEFDPPLQHKNQEMNTIYKNSISLPTGLTSIHGHLIMGLLGSKSNNTYGISGYCIDCTYSIVTADVGKPQVRKENGFDSLGNCNDLMFPNDTFYKCAHRALDGALNSVENSINYLIDNGSQILNISNSISDKLSLDETNSQGFPILDNEDNDRNTYTSCDKQELFLGHKQELCDILENAKKRDIVIVASAGNDKRHTMAWPANDNNVIGVVGTDKNGRLWSESNCPYANSSDKGIETECGSNFDASRSKFAAPAKDILLYHPTGDYNSDFGCTDNNFLFLDDRGYPISDSGYQRCSGTSFSAPIITSIVSMIRSVNPLISFDDVKQVLWDAKVEGLSDQRYSIPQADKSVDITLGKSNGQQVVNRLTPMFRLQYGSLTSTEISYLSTTIPQVAVAALIGTYMVKPRESTGKINDLDKIIYSSDESSPLVTGYDQFKSERSLSSRPRAPFFVFGGHRNPFNNQEDLIPLYHKAKPKSLERDCLDKADHFYSTVKSANPITCTSHPGLQHLYEGIEGYILPNCPPGINCYDKNNGNANDLQCLKVRYSYSDKSFALIMESELVAASVNYKSKFDSYDIYYPELDLTDSSVQPALITSINGMENAECLGYVFPNVDSDADGIIDGMELVLGTNPHLSDSDLDGFNDGIEYPLTGIPASDPVLSDSVPQQ